MATAKTATKGAAKGMSVCAECDTEFTGSACPECGNSKGNARLASDGIKQQYHTHDSIFGNVDDLEGYCRTTDEDFLMSVQNAKMAQEEFTENMRQSRVMSSEIKKIEKEKKLFEKKEELKRLQEGWGENTYPPEQPNGSAAQHVGGMISEQPIFGAQSPQAQFMSQLMKMDGEKRSEFMEQLSDADPAALQTLSNMFVQPAQNPMTQQMGMPGMYSPSWMQQPPQQQQHEQQESTTTVMREMFSLMKEMQPQRDEAAVEIIRELKDEIKSLHLRVDTVGKQEQNGSGNSTDALVQYVKQLEKKIEASQYRPSFSEQAKELKDTIQSLESIGLVNNNNSATSIDDKIRMKELDHKIEMENKQYTIDEEVAESNHLKQKIREDLAKQIFTQGFAPHKEETDPDPNPASVQSNPFFNPLAPMPKAMTKPKVVVDEIQSEAGTVCEMRDAPVQESDA